MKHLMQLQKQFQQFILTGQSEIIQSVLSTKEVSAKKRLTIYHDAYYLRLIECLTTTFPALHSYLGTEEFQKMCRNFIAAYPSHYRSIRWYGDMLSNFLKAYYDKPYAFLAELADFEWKMTLAFDAQDKEVVRLEDIMAVPAEAWAELYFTPHSSVQRVNYLWNAIPLWQTLIADKELPEIQKDAQPKSWVLWRGPEYIIQYYSLSKEETWMFDGMQQGLSFGALCAGLCEWIEADKVAMSAASYLKNWVQKGMLADLKF
jgi:hypothetical protein